MENRLLAPNVWKLGVIDWDRRLFDSLIPLPDGTSYNSYLVKGSEKRCLRQSTIVGVGSAFTSGVMWQSIAVVSPAVGSASQSTLSRSSVEAICRNSDAGIRTRNTCSAL